MTAKIEKTPQEIALRRFEEEAERSILNIAQLAQVEALSVRCVGIKELPGKPETLK